MSQYSRLMSHQDRGTLPSGERQHASGQVSDGLAKGAIGQSSDPIAGLSSALEKMQVPDFADRFATVADLLPDDAFATVRLQAEGLAAGERNFIPAHKKGGTIAYDVIKRDAPALAALYHGDALQSFVSRLVGETVQPTPAHDQSSLSVLIYDRPGDHIGWHYDHNFYRGRHFTILLPVINIGHDADGRSHARLIAKLGGAEVEVASPPNKLIVFEGARVLHRVTPVRADERRVVVSMTYCVDARISVFGEAARRIKDVAFFGVRALWAGSRSRQLQRVTRRTDHTSGSGS